MPPPPAPVAKPWTCRLCQAPQPAGTHRCHVPGCAAPRRPTGGERRQAAKAEALREAALRGDLWRVEPPPVERGIDACVEWLNGLNVTIRRAIEKGDPDETKIGVMQGLMKAATQGRNRENAPHRERLLQLRERTHGTPYLPLVIGEDPPADLAALPLWHYYRLLRDLHEASMVPEMTADLAKSYRRKAEAARAGFFLREQHQADELTRETGTKDVHAAAQVKALVWPVIATEHSPAPEGAPVLFTANPGPQSRFVESDVSEILYGGKMGGGKSAGLLIGALQHLFRYPHPDNQALICRYSWAEIPRQPFYQMALMALGKLAARGFPVQWHGDLHFWELGPYGRLWFGYLDSVLATNRYQGGEFCYLGIDEATLVPPPAVDILASERMRTRPGVPARVRLTSNPGGPHHGHYLKVYAPWLDRRPSYVEAAAAGVVPMAEPGEVLWYIVDGDREVWVPAGTPGARSRTYIPASVSDTPQYDVEQYLAMLQGIKDPLRRAQMMGGDWSAEHSAGKVFRRGWFKQVSELPRRIRRYVRSWDMAWGVSDSACWTAGVLMGEMDGGGWVVLDVTRLRGSEGTTHCSGSKIR